MQVEPTLLPLTGERMKCRTAIITNEDRLDIKARGFWIQEQQEFLNVRFLTQTHADTRIHPYHIVVQPAKKKKPMTNALCKSDKEPSTPWYL